MTNTKINFCGVEFKNPIVTASGTFGFGMEYNEFVSIEEYGGFGAKGLTRVPREGNKPPRIAETPSGILNITAILTATPFVTCSFITLCSPSMTLDENSTPRFTGPGCITSAPGFASFNLSLSTPKNL